MASSPETSPPKTDPTLLDNLNTSMTNPTSLEQTPPPSSSPPPPPEESPPPSPPLPASPPPEQPPPPNPTPPPPASSPPPNPTPTPTPPPPEASPPPPSTPPPSSTPVLPSQAPPPPPAATTPPPPSTVPALPPPPPVGGSPPEAPVAISPPPPAANNGSQTPAPLPPVHNPRSPSADNSGIQGDLTTTSSSSSSPDTTIQGVMIAGIAVGAVLVIVLSIVIGVLLFLRKRKKPQGPQYYMDGRPPKGGEQYYNDPTQWHSPRPMDQNMQLPPPPGYMGGPWGAPPAGNNSSDMSSGYSGQHPTPMQPPSSSMGGITNFSYDELAAATNGFSQANLLGQGGFGFVHKGVLITSHDRREVAVKSLKSGSGQGEREFQAEVEIISRVHHRHLVSLVGYCIANQQRLLVYEFVPNKTLEFHLHGKGQPVMDWATRLRIAVGSAKGLAYLHEDCMPRIIHRDIKAANILLDNNFEAMVADFGLAKLTSDNFTHVSTRVMGTFGYLAPEYASSGKLTEKSDVFSYGVMLLELTTGRRPVDTTNRFMEDSLVDWARPLLTKALEDGNYEQLVDPRLEGNYNPHEMIRMLTCAAASIRHSARRRPKMSQIVRALEGDSSLEDMNEGVKPGQSAIFNPNGGTDIYDTRAYNADMLKFKKMVMSSQDFNSSEYGGTSEFGLNPSASSSSGSLQRDSQDMKP